MTSLPSAQISHTSFDFCDTLTTKTQRPDRYRDLQNACQESEYLIASGSGLSYCLASADAKSTTLDMRLFNRFLSLDKTAGLVRVEAGARLGEILKVIIPAGWYLPALPGHPAITLGGCLAFNIHGKSQFAFGNFENSVVRFTLFHPDHGELVCDRQQNAEIFWLTLGGCGWTGLIYDVTLQLERLAGSRIRRHAVPCGNLVEAATMLKSMEQTYSILYSWNDFSRRGQDFGRGVIYAEGFSGSADQAEYGTISSEFPSQKRMPISLIRRETIPLMNFLYGTKERKATKPRELPLDVGTFPIAGKEFYFSLIGKPGFREYQFIIPFAAVNECSQELEKLFTKHGIHPSLGSLKAFRGKTRDITFCLDGLCIALDIPISGHPNLLNFLQDLDRLVIAHKGIGNVAKDSRLSASTLRAMYPDSEKFWQRLQAFDPKKRFMSHLRRRLEATT